MKFSGCKFISHCEGFTQACENDMQLVHLSLVGNVRDGEGKWEGWEEEGSVRNIPLCWISHTGNPSQQCARVHPFELGRERGG